jgi:hypothetical protein
MVQEVWKRQLLDIKGEVGGGGSKLRTITYHARIPDL